MEWIAGALGVILGLWVSCHAILWRRDPRAAMWWTAMAWLFPFPGAILYYLFGINRIERKAARLRRRHKKPISKPEDMGESLETYLPPSLDHLGAVARLVGKVVKKPLTGGNRVTPLENGEQAYPAMLEAIRKAEHTVGLATYIFNDDRAGNMFIGALAEAAGRGVQIRVLIDDVGSGSAFTWRRVFQKLTDSGIPVAYFLPALVPWRIAYMNLRNHRKILTVDGRIGFTGAMNIHEGHLIESHPKKNLTQDIHFQLEGPVVAQMQEAFCVDWHFTTGEWLKGEGWFPRLYEVGLVHARGISDGPDEEFGYCRLTILSALARAKKSVRVVTPYLILDSTLVSALNVAALSGVQVDIVLPSDNDLALVSWATQGTVWQILERGCRVWLTPRPFDHAKVMVVDGGWTLFGSSNWDPRSLRLNFEFNVECYDDSLARRLENWVDRKIHSARRLTLKEIDARPLPIKLRDGVARLFSPML